MATGSEFIGESFVLLVSGAIVIFEYNRSAASSKANEEKKMLEAKKERQDLQAKLITLDTRLKALEDAVEANTRAMGRFGGKEYHPPQGVPRIIDEIRKEEEAEATIASPAEESKQEKKKGNASVLRWLGFGR